MISSSISRTDCRASGTAVSIVRKLVAAGHQALLAGGCATQSQQPMEPAAETAPDDMATIEPWDGDGLEIPLDGSSKDAWERSLLRVKAHSEPADYQLLLSAIDYLLLYDLGAKGDIVDVADGYARNYLVPRAFAVRATPGALQQADAMRRAREEAARKALADAEALAQNLVGARVVDDHTV